MRSLLRIFRRYIFTAALVVLLLFCLNAAAYGTLVFQYLGTEKNVGSVRVVADGLTEKQGKIEPDADAREALTAWEWAMLLDAGGRVIWSDRLPQELARTYTLGEVAAFSHWYLKDYPVTVYRQGEKLLVLGASKNSVWKQNISFPMSLLEKILSTIRPVLAANVVLIVLLCLLLGWRLYRKLQGVGEGVEALAEGRSVQLSEKGVTAQLNAQLNRVSALLREKDAQLARRDAARTQWIAGVSHDIRTPLAVVMGYADTMSADAALSERQRTQAEQIRAQSAAISRLIADLNLTSKLEYHAQPLRLTECAPGALLRRSVSEACNALEQRPDAQRWELALEVQPEVETLRCRWDEELIERAVQNLLRNSVRHNPLGCTVVVQAQTVQEKGETWLRLRVEDDGTGYSACVLAALEGWENTAGLAAVQKGESAEEETLAEETEARQPHIMGLHIVRQIITAHKGSVRFCNRAPHGASAVLLLPVLHTAP